MAQNPMMNPLQSAVLGPDVIAQQLRLQQRQQIGQQMLEQGSQAPQGQMVSGHYVAPSITQYLSQGLKGYLGQKALSELPQGMSDLAAAQQQGTNRLFGLTPQALASGLSAQPQEGATTQPGQPSPQSLAQGLGGTMMPGIPGMSRQQQALIASQIGLPEYLKLAANKGGPVNVAPGGSLYNPQTGQVDYTAPKDGIAMQNGQAFAVPGFGAIQAQNAGMEAAATEGAKAQFDLVDVPDGQGGTVQMPRSQAVQALGQGGAQPGGPSGAGMSGFGTSPSKASEDAGSALNKNWITSTYQPTLDNADASRNLAGTIEAMRSIPLDTGFGTEAKAAAANLLTTLGVKDAAKFATDVQKFQSLAMDRLQTELMKQKGPQTEGDAQRAGQTFARLSNTPEANKFIFDFAQAKANQDMRKAEFYQAALPIARRAGDLTEIDRRWRKLQRSIFDDPLLMQYTKPSGEATNGNP